VYLWALAVVVASAAVLAVLRWPHDVHLLVLGALAGVAATVGFLARHYRWSGWVRWHIPAMAASYVLLLTAFYVDNGPFLPGWKSLPHLTYWTLPAAVALPLTVRALYRYRRW
jgi:ABC-type thiamin/hydroxymethylpyrimidine transport system permease subunit